MSFQYKNVYLLWLSLLVIAFDQITKQLVVRHLDWYDVVPVMPYLNLVHMKNTGAAFSMLSDAPPAFFVLLGTAVSVGILWWLRRNPRGQTLLAAALSLIMGGAMGNVVDRVTRGHVVDFIDFYVGNWHFAAFNVADMAISVGTGLLILDMLLDWWRTRRAEKAETS
ncbi:signal peptidase II [Sinimarinibacterium flocculans]|uniref:Lipoprotein signal peptidase n=1 Tax=Sinimarinibacterium flocculans TaxID=985250 RepID=A0A318EBI7_9GAMM|nr:signal peptidase II [Sinimarinibacterium flocculans]MEC9363282.1 signal peptidase II [Pseudomonadota bacterium]PXV68418.1 signal peptidase II [Sinimarinibacterium flocculans]